MLSENDREKKWQITEEITKLLNRVRSLGDDADSEIEGECEDAADLAAWIGNELEILGGGYSEDTD